LVGGKQVSEVVLVDAQPLSARAQPPAFGVGHLLVDKNRVLGAREQWHEVTAVLVAQAVADADGPDVEQKGCGESRAAQEPGAALADADFDPFRAGKRLGPARNLNRLELADRLGRDPPHAVGAKHVDGLAIALEAVNRRRVDAVSRCATS
jgi:hypothetical protein